MQTGFPLQPVISHRHQYNGPSKDHAFISRTERDITGSGYCIGWYTAETAGRSAKRSRHLAAYLEGSELQRLKAAVEAEIARRKQSTSIGRTNEASAPSASRPASSPVETRHVVEIPEGKSNLIRASFSAGLKPATIARTFGMSVSLVNRIIRSTQK